MKNIRGFILYGVILFLLIISTLVVYLIEDTSLNRQITENYDQEYQRYLDCYSLLLENLNDKENAAELIYNRKYSNDSSYIFTKDNIKFSVSKTSDNRLFLNMLDGDKFIYAAEIDMIPGFFYSTRPYLLINEFEEFNIPDEFKEELLSGERLNFINNNFLSIYEFQNKNIRISFDNEWIYIFDEETNKQINKIANTELLYFHFNVCKIKIEPNINHSVSLKPLIVSDGDIEIGDGVVLSGSLITTGEIVNNGVISNGKIVANSIINLDRIERNDVKNIKVRMLENIKSLSSLDIKSFH